MQVILEKNMQESLDEFKVPFLVSLPTGVGIVCHAPKLQEESLYGVLELSSGNIIGLPKGEVFPLPLGAEVALLQE